MVALESAEIYRLNKHPNTLPRAWDAFHAYLFDIDGTLLHCTDAVHYFAFCNALQSVANRPLTLEGVIAHGNTDVGILRDAFALAGIREQDWRPILPRLRDDMCRFVQTRQQELRVTLMRGVPTILQHLHGKGAVLGVATGNLRTIGEAKLKQVNLLPFFDFFGWSDAFEYRCDVFCQAVNEARALVGAEASICVIGDTPADVNAARQNGLSIIAVATGIYNFDQLAAEKPDLCIRSMNELLYADQALPA
jgi:phosphoglycolate phosphatase